MPGLHMHTKYTVPYQTPWDSKALPLELPGLVYSCPIKSSLYPAFYSVLLLLVICFFFFSSKVANLRCYIQRLSICLWCSSELASALTFLLW